MMKYQALSKKAFALILSLLMMFALAACSGQDEISGVEPPMESVNNAAPTPSPTNGSDEEPPATPNADESELQDNGGTETPLPEDDSKTGSNILIAYFSRSGNTLWEDGVDAVTSASINVMENGEFAGNAQLLAGMAQQATGGDLFLIQTVDTYPSDYRETTNVAADEQERNVRPELATHVENMDQYDTIVLIYPNWWGTLPQPLYTFLEEYDFSGKTLLPLCTHEGSGMGSSKRAIAGLCPDVTLLDGLAVRGGNAASAQADVEAWISKSGILK